jgi:hypothetical protein
LGYHSCLLQIFTTLCPRGDTLSYIDETSVDDMSVDEMSWLQFSLRCRYTRCLGFLQFVCHENVNNNIERKDSFSLSFLVTSIFIIQMDFSFIRLFIKLLLSLLLSLSLSLFLCLSLSLSLCLSLYLSLPLSLFLSFVLSQTHTRFSVFVSL